MNHQHEALDEEGVTHGGRGSAKLRFGPAQEQNSAAPSSQAQSKVSTRVKLEGEAAYEQLGKSRAPGPGKPGAREASAARSAVDREGERRARP